jgi:HAE1 family hydrophobic/amphiphilic exporter-1
MSLPSFSVRQVVLVNLVFGLLIVAGLMIARRIPVDFFPDISFNTAEIRTTWRGASPDEMERLVTTKLEEEIDSIVGIKEMFSFSSYGLSEINVEWDEKLSDIDYEAALNDLRAAIDRVDDLPVDADTPILRELSVSEVYNVCMIAVSDVGGVGEFTLREVARHLRDRLERIPGLRRAELQGVRDRELQVLVDKDRALQYDLTLTEISRTIAENNQNFAGGSFTNPSNQEITVRGLGHFVSVRHLAQTVVKKDPDGSHVRLADLAEVVDDFEKRRLIGRYNAQPTIIVGISKEADTDVIDLVSQVRTYLSEYRALLPPGIEAQITWDSSAYVSARIGVMNSNLLLGVVFVICILWLTLGFRNALLAIVGVPFSFLTALMLFPLFDITINALSLVGFVMVSGMLVDDAIIILENIYRHVEDGESLRIAAVKGTEEVMWPVTAAVTTTMAAFLPMLTVSGPSGEFMEILPKTVMVCLIGSLFEALVILPAHYVDWGTRRRAGDVLRGLGAGGGFRALSYRARSQMDAAIERVRDAYLIAQSRILVQRTAFVFACVGLLFFSWGLFTRIPVDLFPGDFNNLFVSVETMSDFGLDQTDAVMREIEGVLDAVRHELTDVTSYVGMGMDADGFPVAGVNRGVLYLSFPNTRENIADPDRMLDLVRTQLDAYARANPEGLVNLLVNPPRDGPPIGKPVAIRIQSDSYRVAKEIAEGMKVELAGLPGVYNIEDNVPLGPRELRIGLDEHRASLHGLTFDDVGFGLAAANEGTVSSTFKDPNSDEDVDIRVLLREDQRRSIADLLDVELRTPSGYLVKLGDVATLDLERGYQRLYHFDAQRAVVVYADVDGVQASSLSVNQHMQAQFSDVPETYAGVNLVFGGEFQATDDAFADMRRALLLAVIAIYGILAAQFRSYVQPLIVMSVIVFSFIGVTLGLFLLSSIFQGYALSLYVLYAMVGLAGIVVNDSLVLIDFVNQERRRGVGALEAVQSASRKRFRPILLTTLTTITGLTPMALGLSGYSKVFGPFAASIVFGLGVASLLTLFVVPTLYLTLEDVKAGIRRRRAAGSSAPDGGVVVPLGEVRRP